MNIKSLNINLTSINDTPRATATAGPKTENSSADRDADGRRDRGAALEKSTLNDQEFDDALKILMETPGLKANNLTVEVEVGDAARVVLILAPDGSVVRRLTESQLWAATRDKDRATGTMLNKKM